MGHAPQDMQNLIAAVSRLSGQVQQMSRQVKRIVDFKEQLESEIDDRFDYLENQIDLICSLVERFTLETVLKAQPAPTAAMEPFHHLDSRQRSDVRARVLSLVRSLADEIAADPPESSAPAPRPSLREVLEGCGIYERESPRKPAAPQLPAAFTPAPAAAPTATRSPVLAIIPKPAARRNRPDRNSTRRGDA